MYSDRNATMSGAVQPGWIAGRTPRGFHYRLFGRDASPAAPAPGETPTIGFSRPPRQRGKVVRALMLARPGVIGAGFALPRVPAPTGRTGQRSAFPCGRHHLDRCGAPARGCIFTATGPPGFHHRLLTACGKTHAAFSRRCIPPEPLRFAPFFVAFRSKYTGYSSLTRLVGRAPHRPRRSREFHHRLLSEVGLGRAHYCAGHQCSAAKPVVLLAQRGEQTGYRRPLPRRPRSGGRSSSPRMSS